MTAIPFDDYTLHAEVHFVSNQLPTLFLIHELAENCQMWDPLITYWKNRFNIVTYDFFGHGRTTDSQVHRVTCNRLVDEAVTVIHSLGLEKIHIIGDDFGGLLAILVANACRLKVQSLSLISTPWVMPRGTFDPWYQLFSQLIHTDRRLLTSKIILMSVYSNLKVPQDSH
jgi:pimeloyl-ACP methyl ester carboxylesterase